MNPPENVSKAPELLPQNNPEAVANSVVGIGAEKAPMGELQPSGGGPQPVTTQAAPQLPPVAPVVQASQQTMTTVNAPLVAADDEVIEQEWVQKAKRIVSETKSDPYSQEREIGKLQAEYVKKRYGKEIKLSSD